MSISSVIGVAAGLVFVYLLLSLMCTSAKEILEVVLRKRSTDLEAGIRQLLNDPQGVGLAKDFFEHPLISSMIPGECLYIFRRLNIHWYFLVNKIQFFFHNSQITF